MTTLTRNRNNGNTKSSSKPPPDNQKSGFPRNLRAPTQNKGSETESERGEGERDKYRPTVAWWPSRDKYRRTSARRPSRCRHPHPFRRVNEAIQGGEIGGKGVRVMI